MYKSSSGACAITHTRSHLHARVLACSSGERLSSGGECSALDLHFVWAYGETAEGSYRTKFRTPTASRCCIKIFLTKSYSKSTKCSSWTQRYTAFTSLYFKNKRLCSFSVWCNAGISIIRKCMFLCTCNITQWTFKVQFQAYSNRNTALQEPLMHRV